MLTIDKYIAKMKKADKLDEFDYLKISENMSTVMRYVMSYFNEYLTMETCDAEEIKFKHAIDKLQEEINQKYPNSVEFILNFYLQHRIRIHKELEKWASKVPYFHLFYSDEDFYSLAKEFCGNYKQSGINMNDYRNEVEILLNEIKTGMTDAPVPSDMLHLDNNIVSWVRDTYRQYGVNLYAFASDLSSSYYERYVKYERDRFGSQNYCVNYYNHRYNNNPFDINHIYEENKHRPFLENRRGELEMLVMHEWLFEEVYDDDYWPEYVNLCITHGRVSLAKNVNALIPVATLGLTFPDDAPCSTEHIVSVDGTLKKAPQKSYILRVDLAHSHSEVWQDTKEMEAIVACLNRTFKEYGVPKILEVTAPIKVVSFSEETFLLCCSLLEKKMKRYSPMKLAIVNGAGNQRSKPSSCISTIEDILKLKALFRERKIHIQFSIDFPSLMSTKRDTGYKNKEIFGALNEIKNSIICLNVTDVQAEARTWPKIRAINDETGICHLNKYKYPTYDDFYTMLSSVFNDNQRRYLIPKNIKNDVELEFLVDNLLRSGFAFCEVGEQNG